jgi:hypothetical protein
MKQIVLVLTAVVMAPFVLIAIMFHVAARVLLAVMK